MLRLNPAGWGIEGSPVHLNTSHVKVKLGTTAQGSYIKFNLNTSHVKVKQWKKDGKVE